MPSIMLQENDISLWAATNLSDLICTSVISVFEEIETRLMSKSLT